MAAENTTESTEPRKRPRVEEAEDAEAGPETKGKPTPEYGSQQYWEERYKTKPGEKDSKNEDDPEPYHAWYFTFEDLAPLLMPVIVGSDNDNDDDVDEESKEESDSEDSKEEENDKGEGKSSENGNQTKLSTEGQNQSHGDNDEEEVCKQQDPDADANDDDEGDNNNESDEEIEGFELAEMDEDEEDENSVKRVGLAKNGPISVLEVGCGDAPLGRDLVLSIQEYGSSSEQDPASIVEKVVCLDYSKNVIELMKEEQEKQQSRQKSEAKAPQLVYEVADARQLSYENGSFEMIIEKGTLDAMLSDSDGSGCENCRKIVSECGRVLKVGGYIVIISHLNARVESGLQWLNDVVVPGLRASGNFEWLVEVHGSEIEIPSDDEGDENEEGKSIESPGPAVYFIEKVGTINPTTNDDGSESSMPTIPLKFFSY